MKLSQNQVWQQGDEYFRIVAMARLQVEYKSVRSLLTRDGRHHRVSKKQFCRLLKGARLLPQDELDQIEFAGASALPPEPVMDDRPFPPVRE